MGAFGNFLVLVIIGVGMGFAITRYGSSWLGRQVDQATGPGDATTALVGIAGSFMGYHIGISLGILWQLVLYVVAMAGAALTVWAWRGR